jgi:hypothetical protein
MILRRGGHQLSNQKPANYFLLASSADTVECLSAAGMLNLTVISRSGSSTPACGTLVRSVISLIACPDACSRRSDLLANWRLL